jgi:hypothetical protein
MNFYNIFLQIFFLFQLLNGTELDSYYFATKTMVLNKLPPHNLHGNQLAEGFYSYSKEKTTMKGVYQETIDEKSILMNITIDNIIIILNNHKQDELINLIDVTQNIRKLFSKKRQDQDIHNLLKSNLNADTYRNSFKDIVYEIKNEYFFNIKLTFCIMCTIFFGARYARSMNPRVVTILLSSSEFLGTCFIVHQSYQWARLRTKYAELGLING